MTRARFSLLSLGLLATCALFATLSMVSTSCSQSTAEIPVRTFEGAGRMAVVCMQVLDDNAGPIPAVPVTQDHCAPVATGVDPTTLQFHLMAVVTQTLRGELAVVDLTAAHVVDTSRALPGTNFLPVGQNPQDVVATPDGAMVFVTAAEVNKPAIYGIPSTLMLGDAQNLDEPTQAAEALSLTSWPSCALPQAPGRMVVVPTPGTSPGDGGVGTSYEIVVLLPGNGRDESAKVALLDATAFMDGTVARGSLAPCPIKAAINLGESLPGWATGPSWPNGLPYVDGGIDLFAQNAAAADAGVLPSTDYQLPLWSCPALAHPTGSTSTADASTLRGDPGVIPQPLAIATDGKFVWISDRTMPLVHVVDASQSGVLREVAPLVATSLVDPSRVVTTSEIAISPTTRDYKRYLYAVDAREGTSMLVYDVTDPENGPRAPLTRPNPELDPFQPSDRILFSAPISTVTFATHDFALTTVNGQQQTTGLTGLLCNPNPNATDPGTAYRANGSGQTVGLGPFRLRGVFAFATLSNGRVATIDVDDWDAPCRRPDLLVAGGLRTGSLAEPEPNLNDQDPYHAPFATPDGGASNDAGGTGNVSSENFWPVILPNRARSTNLLRDDLVGTGGLHEPALVSTPQLLVNGAPVSLDSTHYPLLAAAFPNFTKTLPASPATSPNVYMSHDSPDVHVDQDWTLTYEGAIPGFDGIVGTIDTPDDFASLTLTSGTGSFCARGVEDKRLAAQRVAAMQIDDAALTKPTGWASYLPPRASDRLGDYVQLTDDIVGEADAGVPLDTYWMQDNACWNDITVNNQSLASSGGLPDNSPVAALRQQVCIDKFGATGGEQNPQRDFPILEAYDDHLVLGRYLYTDPVNRPINGRVIGARDTTKQVDFEMVKCCFHNQAHFHVRTGAEWVAVGAVSGYLTHVVADANKACVQSCEGREVLLNSRLPEFTIPAGAKLETITAPSRNSPFALRTPSFSTFLAAPQVTGTDAQNNPLANTFFSISTRDITWKFTTRGQYATQIVSLLGQTTAVVPQSSMFVAPLGMLAVIDGSAEGLFLIDLNTLTIAGGSPFF